MTFMTMLLKPSVASALALCTLLSPMAQAQLQPPPASSTVIISVPKDAWQVRRLATFDLLRTNNNEKLSTEVRSAAYKQFDAVLTAYDNDPLAFTPMEAVDLMEIYYMQEEGKIAMQTSLVAMWSTLGWYDALRFADESGREEILSNEEFFKRAIMVRKDDFIKFITNEPKAAAEAVAKGIRMAESVQGDRIHYDVRWPASYGLLRMQCGLQKLKTCEVPTPLPKAKWPEAFDEAAAKVTRYYRNNN